MILEIARFAVYCFLRKIRADWSFVESIMLVIEWEVWCILQVKDSNAVETELFLLESNFDRKSILQKL